MKPAVAFFRTELFFSTRRAGFYVYYIVLAGLLFLLVQMLGGAFSEMQVLSDNLILNAPAMVQLIMGSVSMLTTFMVSSFAGMGALRDVRSRSDQICFTYPVTRLQYIAGKFLGVYTSLLLLYTAPLLGFAIGCEMPWLQRSAFLPFNITTYVNVFWQVIILNSFFLTAVFFALSLLFRNIVANWVGILFLYMLYILAEQYFNETGTRTLGILLDPYGAVGSSSVQVGQGVQAQNHLQVPLTGLYRWNRILWTIVGLLSLVVSLLVFRFRCQPVVSRQFFRIRSKKQPAVGFTLLPPPKTRHSFDRSFTITVFLNQFGFECQRLFRSTYLYLIFIAGLVFLYCNSHLVGKMWETPGYPTTIGVLQVFGNSIHVFMILLILVLSGELVWRDAQYRLNGMIGSMPASFATRMLAKTAALLIVVGILLLLVLLAGIGLQYTRAYHRYEPALYVQYLFGYLGARYCFYIVLATALQLLARNRFEGYAFFAAVFVFSQYFARQLFHYGMFAPGYTPAVTYSDLGGFQHSYYPFLVFLLYWWLGAWLLWKAAVRLFPVAGCETFRNRWKQLLTGKRSGITRMAVAGFVASGGFIFYNTAILNCRLSERAVNKLAAGYEKKYGHLRAAAQLSIIRVTGNIHLRPSEQIMTAGMQLVLLNKSRQPVRYIYLNLPGHNKVSGLQCSAAWKPLFNDADLDFCGFVLQQAVPPGDSILLTYRFASRPQGFTDKGIVSLVSHNGTFLNSTAFMPVIGYSAQHELSGSHLREQYLLRRKPYAPLLSDTLAQQESFFGPGADRVYLHLTIRTEKDQTAIAPGYLEKQWDTGSDRFFTYAMNVPSVNYFSIQSGRYAIRTEPFIVPGDSTQHPVQLSIYYHPEHAWNLDAMLQGMKDALSYNTHAFGPYPYRQLRIVEFPKGSFAQSFANNIAFSENMGFTADLRSTAPATPDGLPEDAPVNYTYFVTLHEAAHQWWAHQVVPANTEGNAFVAETMSQYSAVMAYKKRYGAAATRRLLEYYAFQYLSGRGSEQQEERPLQTVLDQSYIFYAKGIGAMYALARYIGEEPMNQALKRFVQQYAFKERPYVTADQLVACLKAAAPDSVRYLVSDCLEKIVVYRNQILEAHYQLDPETLVYTVTATINARKMVYRSGGKAVAVPMNDYVELGILNKDKKQVAGQTVRLHSGKNRIVFETSRRPAYLLLHPDFDVQEMAYHKTLRTVVVKKL